jgi:hypothetical protein
MIDFRPILAAILDEYALLRDGIHGVSHWARVMENGLRLAKATGASVEVVGLFAVFHDSMRINDGHDPEHGRRGADFARSLRGELFNSSTWPMTTSIGSTRRAPATRTNRRTPTSRSRPAGTPTGSTWGGSASRLIPAVSAPTKPGSGKRSIGHTAGRRSSCCPTLSGKSGELKCRSVVSLDECEGAVPHGSHPRSRNA